MSAGQQRAKATFWLLQAPDSLSIQSEREPDGTGLGWFDEHGEPQVSKQPIAAHEDLQFASEAKEISSRTFIAHIRFASTGALKLENTHPFKQDGRLFAHNGVIEDLPKLEAHLGEALGRVTGETDSERFFALISQEISKRDGDVPAGIAAACEWVAEELALFAINFVLASEDRVWALRYPDTHELWVLELAPGESLEQSSSLGSRVSSEHCTESPLVVIASERMDEDPNWRLLESGRLLEVGPNLELGSRQILEGPPKRLLSLADLSGKARASQTKGRGQAVGS